MTYYNYTNLKIVTFNIITLFSISKQFDSISNIEIEYRLELSRVDYKLARIESKFKSISNVEIVELSRFQ